MLTTNEQRACNSPKFFASAGVYASSMASAHKFFAEFFEKTP
jgi:hypothetical protein